VLSGWRIRYKLLLGVTLLFVIVAVLSATSIRGVYSYKHLARTVSIRATELPLAAKLAQRVDDLRVVHQRSLDARDTARRMPIAINGGDSYFLRGEFRQNLHLVFDALELYKMQLKENVERDPSIDGIRQELDTVAKIDLTAKRIAFLHNDDNWMLNDATMQQLTDDLDELRRLTNELPTFLHGRMHAFAGNAKSEYQTLIAVAWTTTLLSAGLLAWLVRLFYVWIFRPLQVLVYGSRLVALGDFDHHIYLHSQDEMSELAGAMNAMTRRFREIRNELNEEVRLRTREVVRSEQLASVGFLAAGVAHEINNPLASIAICAESLEERIDEVLGGEEEDEAISPEMREEIAVLRKYLQGIQDEAFRCKGITEKLLDFSRLGDSQRERTDLCELVTDVVDMVRVVGKFKEKQIEFVCDEPVIAPVCAQEIKQVALNLITNALDSLDPGGVVNVSLATKGEYAELVVTDNGCGMTEEVLNHLFQPFFTRRRDGSGTGLGLSITFSIINDHGGKILAHSDGPGTGSTFRVQLPRETHEKENRKAA